MFRVSSTHLQEDIVVYKQHMVPSLSIRVLVSFLKEIGFIADGWLQRVHNLSSVTTVPVTSYIEVLQIVDLYLFNGGE